MKYCKPYWDKERQAAIERGEELKTIEEWLEDDDFIKATGFDCQGLG